MARLVLRADTDGKGSRGKGSDPTPREVRLSETAKFARDYGRLMETTGHCSAQRRLIDRLRQEGAVTPKFCDIGCGTGEMLGYLLRTVFSQEIESRVRSHTTGDAVDPIDLVGIDESSAMLRLAVSTITATLASEAASLNMHFARNRISIEVEFGSKEFTLFAKVSGEERPRTAIVIVRLLEGSLTDLSHPRRQASIHASTADTFLISYVMHWLSQNERLEGLVALREMLLQKEKGELVSLEECPLKLPPREILVSSTLLRTRIPSLARLIRYFEDAGLQLADGLSFSRIINEDTVRVGTTDYPHKLFANVFVPK